MGEVCRARDAKLGRDVALKVLPEAFARDAERMARFQHEAKVLALFRSVRARLGMVRIDSERGVCKAKKPSHPQPAPTGHALPFEHFSDLEIGFLDSVLPWADTGSRTSGQRLCEIIPLMKATIAFIPRAFLVLSASLAPLPAQTPGSQQQQPEFIQQGQQLMREGKLDDALALYRQTLQVSPNSVPANIAAGSVLDLMGQGEEAREYLAKAIQVADTPEQKAMAQRAMAMSYAFEGNCKKTLEYEKQVFDY
jgi:tetratricopeptide (TPR) repeat protein